MYFKYLKWLFKNLFLISHIFRDNIFVILFYMSDYYIIWMYMKYPLKLNELAYDGYYSKLDQHDPKAIEQWIKLWK